MHLELIFAIALLIALMVFLFYASVAINHAVRFRYLSARTVYLTLAFVSTAFLLILLAIGAYISLIVMV